VEEPAFPGVAGAGVVGVGVEEVVEIPAPAVGKRCDGVVPAGRQLPQFFRAVHPARVAAGHRHDGDGFVPSGFDVAQALPGLVEVGCHLPEIAEKLLLVRHRYQLS
jgi:hypothetical protein